MANQPVPSSGTSLKSPQVVVAVISGAVTLIAAIIGVLPNLTRSDPTVTPSVIPIIVTATPVPAGENVIASSPIPTVTPLQPTPLAILLTDTSSTPAPLSQPGVDSSSVPNVQLLYDAVSFTLLNQGGEVLSLEGVTFQSASGAWDARQWGPSIYTSLPADQCLRLRDVTAGQRTPPSPCVNHIYGLIEVGQSALFWINTPEFAVLRNGQIIATCATTGDVCSVFIPSG